MITTQIEQALNQQIQMEGFASNYYLAAASWADAQSLEGCAAFLYRHAEEERSHMMRLFRYINDAGGHAIVPEFRQPPNHFSSLAELFQKLLDHELEVSAQINRLVLLCLEQRDFATHHFLQWYVAEQHEEEKLFRSIIEKIHLLESEGKRGIYWIDRELGEKKVE